MLARGERFLLDSQNADGGWGGAAGSPSSIEQTALALEALARISRLDRDWVVGWDQPPAGRSPTLPPGDEKRWEIGLRPISPTLLTAAISRGTDWLIRATDGGQNFPATPIGLYFAKLWYSETLYPLIFTVSALRELSADRSP
jgi:squalene-hopene/tetraprenyl-beta-curcumene cyclase